MRDLKNIIEAIGCVSDEESQEFEEMVKYEDLVMDYKKKQQIINSSMLNREKLNFLRESSKANIKLFSKFEFEEGIDYLFKGGFGLGKTTLCHLIAVDHYLKKNKTVRFLTKYNLKKVASQIAAGDLDIRDWIEVYDLVIIDDFGQVDYTDKQLDVINEFIGERPEYGKRVIISSNVKYNHLLTDRTLDRIDSYYKILQFKGKSKRLKIKSKEIIYET